MLPMFLTHDPTFRISATYMHRTRTDQMNRPDLRPIILEQYIYLNMYVCVACAHTVFDTPLIKLRNRGRLRRRGVNSYIHEL